MSDNNWFSAKIRLACLVESQGLHRYQDSVYVFSGVDFDDAFSKALAIGKAQERSYMNGDEELVRWRLKEIISLDLLGHEPLNASGFEVYSELVEPSPAKQFEFDHEFQPADSKPTQTV